MGSAGEESACSKDWVNAYTEAPEKRIKFMNASGGKDALPTTWRTTCGWQFGTTGKGQLHPMIPHGVPCCEVCFPPYAVDAPQEVAEEDI